VVGCCEHGNEPLGSIKSGEFLDWLNQGLCSIELVLSSLYFFGYNLKVSQLSHVCNCWSINISYRICRYLYDFSHSRLQLFVSYLHKTGNQNIDFLQPPYCFTFHEKLYLNESYIIFEFLLSFRALY